MSETVIVIRSLVPGGVAQQDGRLIPGDRLMFVNEVNLAHASLDEAVSWAISQLGEFGGAAAPELERERAQLVVRDIAHAQSASLRPGPA